VAPSPDHTRALGYVALGTAASWNTGVLGPTAGEVASSLGLSLGAVGVLGATTFFAGLVVAKLGAARLTAAIGTRRAWRVTALALLGGNLLVAVAPWSAALACGRLTTGIGLGLTLVLGPVLAREAGGDRLVGIFGAAATIGVAGAIGVGSLIREAGLDWQVDFAVAAATALIALALTPTTVDAKVPSGSVLAIFRRSVSRASAWRLELLFTTALGVPYILGVWLVPYLTGEAGLTAVAAGALGFGLFGLSAILRPEGGRLDAEGRSLTLLGGVAPLAAAAGLVVLALTDSLAIGAVGVLLAGIGFAIPYAAMYDEAAHMFPGARIATIGLFSVGANVLPLALAPIVGAAISEGHGTEALLVLAVVPLLAGVANLRPAVPR